MTFEHPGYLVLLSLVPVGVYLRHIWTGRGGRVSFSFSVWRGDAFAYPAILLRTLRFVAESAFWSGTVLWILALAGPVRVERDTVYLTRGMDVVVVLDESPSMSAQDFTPENRFEAAKEVIRDFVTGREYDAIGLVSFSREAALRVPPTLDTEAFLAGLDALRIMSLGDGTAIGMGLAVATMHLERSGAEERVIVLLTDGENNAGEILPETAADLARRLGIRVYVIGVGTTGEVPIEYTDPATGVIRSGLFESRFNESLLRSISEQTGGRYYSAQSPGALNAVFRSIDAVETTERRAKIEVRTTSLYRRYVAIGLILLVLNFLVRTLLLREALAC